MTITKLHFSVSGEYITNIARQVWVEGELDKAIKIMGDVIGLPDADKMAVIQGKKKLVGDSDVGISLEDDNVTECCGIKILSYEEEFAKQRAKVRRAKLEARITMEILNRDGENIASPWGLLFVPRSLLDWRVSIGSGRRYFIKPRDGEVGMDTWERFEREFSGLVDEARDRADKFRRKMVNGYVPSINGSVNTEQLLDNFLEESNKEIKTSPDASLVGLNGWIFPDGKFYSCGFMGHIRLADALGSTEGKLEEDCVKVQDCKEPLAVIPRDGGNFPHIPLKGVTQAQFDTMWGWCQKHGRELPKDIIVSS